MIVTELGKRSNIIVSARGKDIKAIAYAKVKTDKVDARILADLLRTDMIPEN